MIFIGDMHSSWIDYKTILEKNKRLGNYTFQVGDLGLGFMPIPEDYRKWINPEVNRYIRGNHDCPDLCTWDTGYMGSFGPYRNGSHNMFFVSGAQSTDRQYRLNGFDWWPNEELDWMQLESAIETYKYQTRKTNIFLSHCAPTSITKLITDRPCDSLTEIALENMLEINRPDMWIFGHHHHWFDKTIDGTRFVCVPSLQEFEVR